MFWRKIIFLAVVGVSAVFGMAASPSLPDEERSAGAGDQARFNAHMRLSQPLLRSSALGMYLPYRIKVFQSYVAGENKAANGAVKIRGNVGERLMDDFYLKDGWEKIEGQYGAQGIDGLYVKRNANGTVVKFQVVDSKVASSLLVKTKHGWQLSDEWTRNNLEILLKNARSNYASNPSQENLNLVRDYEQILSLFDHGVRKASRVYHSEIVIVNGKTILRQQNGVAVPGKNNRMEVIYPPAQKPMEIDMRKPYGQMSKMEKKVLRGYYEDVKKALEKAGVSKKEANRIANDLKRKIKNGEIKTSKGVNKYLTNELASKARIRNRIARVGGVLFGGLTEAGFELAKSGFGSGIDAESLKEAGGAFVKGASTYALLDVGISYGGKKLSKKIATDIAKKAVAKRFSQKMAKGAFEGVTKAEIKKRMAEATKRMANQTAKKLLPKIVGSAGGVVQVLFSAYEIAHTAVAYNSGTITRRDAVVYSSAGGFAIVTTTAGVIIAYSSYGAALGSAAGPLGTAIGVVGGLISGVGSFAYGLYSGYQKQRSRELEIHERNRWMSGKIDTDMNNTIRDLDEWGHCEIESSWKQLLGETVDAGKLGVDCSGVLLDNKKEKKSFE